MVELVIVNDMTLVKGVKGEEKRRAPRGVLRGRFYDPSKAQVVSPSFGTGMRGARTLFLDKG